jgi:hypothetical protein
LGHVVALLSQPPPEARLLGLHVLAHETYHPCGVRGVIAADRADER